MRSSNGYLVRTQLRDRRDPFREFDTLVRTAFGTPASTATPTGFSPGRRVAPRR